MGVKETFLFPIDTFTMGAHYVGEAGGLQDFMWGFGMRYAITSGVYAAHSIMGQSDYEKKVRNHLVPLIKVGAINRFLMNRLGDRGFKMVANYWMRHQARKGDGLEFMK